jgi:hypothetical protein
MKTENRHLKGYFKGKLDNKTYMEFIDIIKKLIWKKNWNCRAKKREPNTNISGRFSINNFIH